MTRPFIADADREKLEQCDSKYARYLCKIMGCYFDYHKDAYFIKGLYLLWSCRGTKQFSLSTCIVDRSGPGTWLHIEMFAGVYLHDPTTLIAAVNPSLLTYTEGVVRVQTVGITKGLTVFDNTKKRLAKHMEENAQDLRMQWCAPNPVVHLLWRILLPGSFAWRIAQPSCDVENSVWCTDHLKLVFQIRRDHSLDRHADREGCSHRWCPCRGGADDAEADDGWLINSRWFARPETDCWIIPLFAVPQEGSWLKLMLHYAVPL